MWNRLNLRSQIYIILVFILVITTAGGVVMVWYTYRMESLLTRIIDEEVKAFQVAESLETALVNQKGFISYYYLDRDPDWLKQLGEYRRIFKERLETAQTFVKDDIQKQAITRLETEYDAYIKIKDRVISLYKSDDNDTGSKLHQSARDQFFRLLILCENYKNIHILRIHDARDKSQDQAKNLRLISAFALLTISCLVSVLAYVLVNHILMPVRKLLLVTDRHQTRLNEDEIKALSRSVHGLIEDAGQTQMELERSRESLLQAEKMAMVGKLAAGTAHSIRNPLTSVKMRLFSLNRSLTLNDVQKEDFDVISQEIRHIDTILQNFLEFSRPPKLKLQNVSPSTVIEMAVQLLKHRLESHDVRVHVIRNAPLPEIPLDSEQLKEVIVNLMVNACEAIGSGGTIDIHEEIVKTSSGESIHIRINDSGPGISETVRHKIFEPFFTTKDEGTGLGLSIASRIVEEHGGRLDIESSAKTGTTFRIEFDLPG